MRFQESLVGKDYDGAWHLFMVLEGKCVLSSAVDDVLHSYQFLGGQNRRSQKSEDYRINSTGKQCI